MELTYQSNEGHWNTCSALRCDTMSLVTLSLAICRDTRRLCFCISERTNSGVLMFSSSSARPACVYL